MAEQKIWWGPMMEQKIVGPSAIGWQGGSLGHLVVGTPSASAKRSAEQKMVELKLAERKFGGDPRPLGGRDP